MTSPPAGESVTIESRDTLNDSLPSLEHLVAYFVAAKAALTAVNHVYRANEIVALARKSIETVAATHAQNSFLNRSVKKQIRVAKAVRQGLSTRADHAHADFKAVLRILDEVDAGVKQILENLRNTYAEPSFRPDETSPKCLYDFVDEKGLDELRALFRTCIDNTNTAQDVLATALDELDAQIEAAEAAMTTRADSSVGNSISSVAPTFHALENHATELADLLQSLVRHYDLCTTALKHTEGGIEAAGRASSDMPASTNIGGFEPDTPAQPMSENERTEMLRVVDNDATEVDDVVQEIRDHASDMEFQLEQITNQLNMVKTEHTSIKHTIQLLSELGDHLPQYIADSTIFMECWKEQKREIERRMEELQDVRAFYENFLNAYDGLVIEIARRRKVNSTIEKLKASITNDLRQIYEGAFRSKTVRCITDEPFAADDEDRENFTLEQGAYLPADLWPGLASRPGRYELVPVEQEGLEVLPEIGKEALQRALGRNGGSTKT